MSGIAIVPYAEPGDPDQRETMIRDRVIANKG
jgi:hypothetical protein